MTSKRAAKIESNEKITLTRGELLNLMWGAAAEAISIGECWDLGDERVQNRLQAALVFTIREQFPREA